jgi:ATP-binding cassette, subfamily F, member 3
MKEKKTQLEAALSDPATYSDKAKFVQAETDYKSATERLNSLTTEYEKLFEKIMQMETEMGG